MDTPPPQIPCVVVYFYFIDVHIVYVNGKYIPNKKANATMYSIVKILSSGIIVFYSDGVNNLVLSSHLIFTLKIVKKEIMLLVCHQLILLERSVEC
jgi:hypothetical protein